MFAAFLSLLMTGLLARIATKRGPLFFFGMLLVSAGAVGLVYGNWQYRSVDLFGFESYLARAEIINAVLQVNIIGSALIIYAWTLTILGSIFLNIERSEISLVAGEHSLSAIAGRSVNRFLDNFRFLPYLASWGFLFACYGNELFFRYVYLPDANLLLKTLYNFSVILLSLRVVFGAKLGLTESFLILLTLFFVLGTGSRLAALFYLAVGARFVFTLYRSRISTPLKLVFIFGVCYLFAAILANFFALRTLPTHGISSYASFIFDFQRVSDSFAFLLYYSSAYSFVVTAMTIDHCSDPQVAVQLNPLPGFLTSWNEVAPDLKVNRYVPYNFFGELVCASSFDRLFIIFVIGNLLSLQQLFYHVCVENRRFLLAQILIGLTLFFTLFSLQYHLRSSMRILLYSVVLVSTVYYSQRIFRVKRPK